MRTIKSQNDATLLDVLVDGFEKNEVMDGFHWRDLPMPDEDAAARKFAALVEEATRWKGAPGRIENGASRHLASWHDLEIRAAGRGIMVRVRAPWFDAWWHEQPTWEGDPMGPIHAWLSSEREGEARDR